MTSDEVDESIESPRLMDSRSWPLAGCISGGLKMNGAAVIDWDSLTFSLTQNDYMYVAECYI